MSGASQVDTQSALLPSLPPSLPYPRRRHLGESHARRPEEQSGPRSEPGDGGGVGQHELHQGLSVPALLHGKGGDDAALCGG